MGDNHSSENSLSPTLSEQLALYGTDGIHNGKDIIERLLKMNCTSPLVPTNGESKDKSTSMLT